jgi:hypothetical protein
MRYSVSAYIYAWTEGTVKNFHEDLKEKPKPSIYLSPAFYGYNDVFETSEHYLFTVA